MPINSGLLQQIAAGGQSLVPEMMRKGAQLGQQLKTAQQADADRSALQQIAQSFGAGGSDAAIQTASQLGQLSPAMQLQQQQQRAQQAADVQALRQQQLTSQEDFNRQRLELQRQGLAIRQQAADAPGAGDFTKGTAVIVNRDGQDVIATPVLNKETGQMELVETPVSGALVSRLGETGSQQTIRAIDEARGKATVTGKAKRVQEIISTGMAAADQLATVKRSIDLLDSVATGGFANMALQARQLFGVEGADEAELSTNLGKAVLSQLRRTFGAAFTEREGARLERIEAGFGKSAAGNKRLLQQLQKIVEREARRGIRAAKESGDDFSVEEIENAMNFSLDVPAEQSPSAPTATGPNGEKLILQNGQWVLQ